jgi:hypothetical protein
MMLHFLSLKPPFVCPLWVVFERRKLSINSPSFAELFGYFE